MKTFVGTVIYLDDLVYGVNLQQPHLYVKKNVIYTLSDSNDNSQFEKFDNVKVKVDGMLYDGEILQVNSIDEVE